MRVGWVRIGDFRPISRRCEIRQRLLLITNRKSNTRFRLVPKSTTLVYPEMTLDGNYALRCIGLRRSRVATNKKQVYTYIIVRARTFRPFLQRIKISGFCYVAARRHIFVCFMAKSAFWRGFSALAPYTGVGPI